MKRYTILILITVNCIFARGLGNTNPKLQSMLLPGWGEYALRESKIAQRFFLSEVMIWMLYIGSIKTENWYRSDYTAFAILHAEVDMYGKPYLFDVNLGHYNNLEEYNDSKERQRLPNEKYLEGEYTWQWDSKLNRIKYDKMRIKSVTAGKYARFAMAGLVLNRLVSLINVIYLERQKQSFSLNSQVYGNSDQIEVKFSLIF